MAMQLDEKDYELAMYAEIEGEFEAFLDSEMKEALEYDRAIVGAYSRLNTDKGF